MEIPEEKTPPKPSHLSQSDILALAEIITAARKGKRVSWIINDSGNLIYGTARYICKDNTGLSLAFDSDDILTCFLRVTSRAGFEKFLLISDVLRDIKSGEFVIDPYEVV